MSSETRFHTWPVSAPSIQRCWREIGGHFAGYQGAACLSSVGVLKCKGKMLHPWLVWQLQVWLCAVDCCYSVTQSCPTLCDPMDCSMPGFPVHHQFPEPTQTHVHWVGDAIQPSHPLSSPSLPAFHLSQHQGLFQWVGSSHQVAKVLEFQLKHQSFQWIFCGSVQFSSVPELCPTLCEPMDCSTQSIQWILLSHFSRVRLCATPWTAAYQASPSMGFSRQEYCSGLPFPSPMHERGKWKWSRSVVSDS